MKTFFALLFAALLAAGCNSNGREQNTSDLRTLNAVADAEPLDVLVDDDVKFGAVAAGVTTGYITFSSGSRNIKARSTATKAVLYDGSVKFASAGRYTLVLYGKRGAVSAFTLAEDTTKGIAGQARIRLTSVADVGPVDLYLAPSATALGTAVVGPIGFGGTSAFAGVPIGPTHVILTAAGTTNVLYDAPAPVSLVDRGSYTVVVTPSQGGSLPNVVFLEQGDGPGTSIPNPQARIRTVNGVPATVTVKLDATTIAAGLPFTGITGYGATATGTHTARLELANVPGSTIATQGVRLDAGRDTTLVALGPEASPRLLAVTDDNSAPTLGSARLRLVNVLTDSAADLRLDSTSLFANIAAGAASSYAEVLPATATITVTTPGGGTQVAVIAGAVLEANNVYTVFVFGSLGGSQAILVRDR